MGLNFNFLYMLSAFLPEDYSSKRSPLYLCYLKAIDILVVACFSISMRPLSALVFGILSVLVVFVFVQQAGASHINEVLGDSAYLRASDVNFPAVAAGPGFILPDSSLYPLDELVQEIRLLFAFTPEQKALVQMRIAGERMAELRIMMNRNDTRGIEIALSGLEKAALASAEAISDAGAKGKVQPEQVKQLNDTLSEYRRVLAVAASSSPSSLAYKLAAAGETLLEAKVRVEEQLPPNELANAIDNDLQDEIERDVLGVQTAADKLMQRLSTVDTRSNLSSEQKMKQEEFIASKSALKNEYLEQRRKLLEEYNERRKRLQEERKQILEQIRRLLQKLRENQKALRQLQEAQNTGVLPSLTPTVTILPSE